VTADHDIGFLKCWKSLADGVWRAETHNLAKFHQSVKPLWMYQFLISKMVQIFTARMGIEGLCASPYQMSNENGQMVFEMLWFLQLSRRSRSHVLAFQFSERINSQVGGRVKLVELSICCWDRQFIDYARLWPFTTLYFFSVNPDHPTNST